MVKNEFILMKRFEHFGEHSYDIIERIIANFSALELVAVAFIDTDRMLQLEDEA